jgi:hypothetical protein
MSSTRISRRVKPARESVYRALLDASANRLERMGFASGDILTNY